MVAAIGELEAIRLVSVNLSMGRVSTIGSRAMVAVVISELEARQLIYVNLRMGRVSSIGPRARMAAAVISELEVIRLVSVDVIGRVSSIAHSR